MARVTLRVLLVILALGGLGTAGRAQPVQTIKVSMVSFKFAPDLITLHEGQRTVLHLTNDDTQQRAHSLASMYLNATAYTVEGPAKQGVTPDGVKYILLEADQAADMTLVPTGRGPWSMFCSVFNHAARGATGAIVAWPAGYRTGSP
ncbi:MAG TPA: hypothetical protein VKW09_13140 [bacterium]|nr:hypothetical protein [bacterium]